MSIPKSSRRQFLQSAAAAASWVAVGGLKARAQSRGPLLVSQGLTPLKFTLSWLPSSMDTPLVTAILKGYFAEEGLEVTYERGYGSADSITKIAADGIHPTLDEERFAQLWLHSYPLHRARIDADLLGKDRPEPTRRIPCRCS